ncbi:hypothetical protein D5R81_17965 [Parashewanella spongiae]|uniref:histidine kinase n=1 Tax=Parashewanella spongiae TaxID=342950 RepID=A0A3A6TD08_9GAMM|nr:histidine kinase [Parashewanella spongiae]MCL1079935.1 histidine kinase [Parashewanella spongiae]RJY06204.1 hypothetical protein D5R81_17965 [Parashewanella spongiae]
MKLILKPNSIRVKLLLGLALVSFFICFSLMFGQFFVNQQARYAVSHGAFDEWFDDTVTNPILASIHDTPELTKSLKQITEPIFIDPQNCNELPRVIAIAIVDKQSKLVSQSGDFDFNAGDLGAQLPIRSRDDLSDVLMDRYNTGIEPYIGDNKLVIKPIVDSNAQTIGATITVIKDVQYLLNDHWTVILKKQNLLDTVFSALMVSLMMIPAGAIVIFIAGRKLNQRLGHLHDVIHQWYQGKFEAKIRIKSNDEIGQSFERLNQLSEKLNQLVTERQHHAAEYEREKLASDLHDTVKQKLFANNLLLASCLKLSENLPENLNENTLKNTLAQVITSNQLAFKQVNDLVEQRYESSFVPIKIYYQKLVHTWQAETNITVELNIDLTDKHENSALFLDNYLILCSALKEGLQNVNKHSQASKVKVELLESNGGVMLIVKDNGRLTESSTLELGQGLSILRSRVEKLFGRFDFEFISTAPFTGAKLTIWLVS